MSTSTIDIQERIKIQSGLLTKIKLMQQHNGIASTPIISLNGKPLIRGVVSYEKIETNYRS